MAEISIHTPTKGATWKDCDTCSTVGFQSTLPRRERPMSTYRFLNLIIISIHTPTKGATNSFLSCMMIQVISIHTPTKGATAILTNNFLIFCSISLINFILYLQIIQILFIFRYKFIFYFIF